jgi:hypothetical protein
VGPAGIINFPSLQLPLEEAGSSESVGWFYILGMARCRVGYQRRAMLILQRLGLLQGPQSGDHLDPGETTNSELITSDKLLGGACAPAVD